MNRLAQLSPLLDVLVDEYVAWLLRVSPGDAIPKVQNRYPSQIENTVKPQPSTPEMDPEPNAQPCLAPCGMHASAERSPAARCTCLRPHAGHDLDPEVLP